MKKMQKRWISFILVFLMAITAVPNSVMAEEIPLSGQTESCTTSEMTVEGGLGKLLSASAAQQQDEKEQMYSVWDIEMNNGETIVSYSAEQECTLVVAVFDEKGKRLITTEKAQINADKEKAIVKLTKTKLPNYYLVSAYMLQIDSNIPLCKSYTTYNYTKKAQSFLEKTEADFPADRILSLDESSTNNFMVCDKDTIVIQKKNGVNIVESADYEKETYFFKNVDKHIKSLKKGDIFVYRYSEDDILIVKVKRISFSKNNTEIIGGSVSMEDAFSYVKINQTSDNAACEIDNSECDDGIVCVDTEQTNQTSLKGANFNSIQNKKLSVERGGKIEATYEWKKGDVKAKVKMAIEAKLVCYIGESYKYFNMQVSINPNASVGFDGKVQPTIYKLGKFSIRPLPIVEISITPKVIFEAKGKLTADLSWKDTYGLSYDQAEGIQIKKSANKIQLEAVPEGSVFIGIGVSPEASVINSKVLSAEFSAQGGLRLKGSMVSGEKQTTDEIHNCKLCIDGDVFIEAKLEAKVKFLNMEKFTFSTEWDQISTKIGDCYYSIDHGKIGWGVCPYVSYKLTVHVVNEQKESIENALVKIEDKSHNAVEGKEGTTGKDGLAQVYLPKGKYYIIITVGDEKIEKDIVVRDAAMTKKYVISSKEEKDEDGDNKEDANKEETSANTEKTTQVLESFKTPYELNAGKTLRIISDNPTYAVVGFNGTSDGAPAIVEVRKYGKDGNYLSGKRYTGKISMGDWISGDEQEMKITVLHGTIRIYNLKETNLKTAPQFILETGGETVEKLIALNKEKVTLKKNKSFQLKAESAWENYELKSVSYESDNWEVATVDGNGKITAKKKGKATITVTGNGGFTCKCKVTVK